MVGLLGQASLKLGELAGLVRNFPDIDLIIPSFARREALLSSKIEGTQSTLENLYAYEAGRKDIDQLADTVEVHNYVRALEYGLSKLKEMPPCLRLIREMHAILMEGVRGQNWNPGSFRTFQNYIGLPGATFEEASYVPPPPNEMQKAMNLLETYINTPTNEPPLIKLGLIHYQFEAIHPFPDGNGRVGRILLPLLLCYWQIFPQPVFYMSAYFEEHRLDYYNRLLWVSQYGDWGSWLEYFLQGISLQAEDVSTRIKEVLNLLNRYRESLEDDPTAGKLIKCVEYIASHPVLTVNRLSKDLGIHYPTANRYIQRLEEAGILEETTGGERNRVFQAREIIRILKRPLSG